MDKENKVQIIDGNENKEANNSVKSDIKLYLVLVLALVSVIVFMVVTVNNHLKTNNTTVINENNVETDYYESDDKEQSEENNQLEISKYYSFLSEKGNGLVFNVSIDEFLDNYNSLKSPYEDYDYKDISLEDFFYIESGTDYNGTNIDIYGCVLSIMGRNNDICIMISKDNNNNITALNLGVQNYNLYTGDARTKILVQYRLLIQSLGVSETTAQSYISDMADNLGVYNIFATYDKGLALYLDSSNSQANYYRICPYTVEQWESASGLNQISIR